MLLTRDEGYSHRTHVTVAPVTTWARRIPVEVALDAADGVARASVVNLDSITTIPQARLQRRLGRLRAETLSAVDTAIHFALGLQQ